MLVTGLLAATASGIAAWRISGPYGERDREDPRLQKIVDPATGRLRLLIYDADGDGRLDTWSHMDGDRVLRLETDEDGDGVIDRWESYRADGSLETIGSSANHDGHADTWQTPPPDTPAPARR